LVQEFASAPFSVQGQEVTVARGLTLAVVAGMMILTGGACNRHAPSTANADAVSVDKAQSAVPETLSQAPAMAEAPRRLGGAGGGAVGGLNRPAATSSVPEPGGRKLIRNSGASLEVKSVEQALVKLRQQAESAGGYVSVEERSRDDRGVNRGSITLHVPSAKLGTVSASLQTVGTIEQSHISATDITEEYFDLELRLGNQRQLQARLIELLNRPDNKLSDLLETERELARVRGEIEQLEGRQRFWDNRVSLAMLAVAVHEPQPAVASAAGGAVAALRHSFSEAADNFVYAIAGIISITGGLIPIAAALVLAVWIIAKLWKLRKRRISRN
jgi:hypothetical protein